MLFPFAVSFACSIFLCIFLSASNFDQDCVNELRNENENAKNFTTFETELGMRVDIRCIISNGHLDCSLLMFGDMRYFSMPDILWKRGEVQLSYYSLAFDLSHLNLMFCFDKKFLEKLDANIRSEFKVGASFSLELKCTTLYKTSKKMLALPEYHENLSELHSGRNYEDIKDTANNSTFQL